MWAVLLFFLDLGWCCFKIFRLLSSRNRLGCGLWCFVLIYLIKKLLIQTEPYSWVSASVTLRSPENFLWSCADVCVTTGSYPDLKYPISCGCALSQIMALVTGLVIWWHMRERSQPKQELGWVKSFKISFFSWDLWECKWGGKAGHCGW